MFFKNIFNSMNPHRIIANIAFQPPKPSYSIDKDIEGKLKLKVNEDPFWSSNVNNTFDISIIKTKNNSKIVCYHIKVDDPNAFTLLVSHGNAVDLGLIIGSLQNMSYELNANVFCYDYSGYGQSSGDCLEANMYADAKAAFEELKSRICESAQGDASSTVDPYDQIGESAQGDASSTVDPNDQIGKSAQGDASSTVDPNVQIGKSARGDASSTVDPNDQIGKSSQGDASSTVDPNVQIGKSARGDASSTVNPIDRIVLYGHSIGTAPTVHLAKDNEVAGVILHSPLTSGYNVAHPNLTFKLPLDPFRNIDKVEKIKSLTMVIHGTKDTVIGIEHGRQLYKKLKNPCKFVECTESGHNDVEMDPKFFNSLREFMETEIPNSKRSGDTGKRQPMG